MKKSGILFFVFLLMYQLAVLMVLGFLMQEVPQIFPNAMIKSPWFLISYQVIMLLLPLAIWLGIKKERLSVHIPNMKLGRTNAFFIVGISFLLLPMMSFLSAVATLFFPNAAAGLFGETMNHSVWVILIAVAVTPAIVEEVVFRGYIQSESPQFPFWGIALLNGFLFGFIHLNPQQFLYAFAMGVMMAYMVHITRSIRAGILSHFFINAFNIVVFRGAMWLLEFTERALEEAGDMEALTAFQESAEAEVSPYMAILVVGVLAMMFTPVAVILFRYFISHNRQRFAVYEIKQALAEGETGESGDCGSSPQ